MRLPTPVPLSEVARVAGARPSGDQSFKVAGVASLESAQPDELSFARSEKWREAALKSRAGALLVGEKFGPLDRPGLVAPDVQGVPGADVALAKIGAFLTKIMAPVQAPGVHGTAVLGKNVTVGEGACVGPCAVLEDGCVVGPRASIGAGCFLGRGVEVGAGTVLHPNVTILRGCRVGSRCEIHPGAVIGGDGFGFINLPDGSYRKIPQLGAVIIEDDVEIGSCTCIDRATLDATVVGRGVKLDNLVHVAHNVVVGPNTVMAAQVGIAGSSKVGGRCQLGGQSGVAGHLTLGDGCRVGAGSPVVKSFGPGLELWGFPAKENISTPSRVKVRLSASMSSSALPWWN